VEEDFVGEADEEEDDDSLVLLVRTDVEIAVDDIEELDLSLPPVEPHPEPATP
jgi:hypothetical protein